ncbi:MAG: hypothetical protein GY755_10310 [Chloroflexi bacterium]|nr:hypothetical protein [Chloroflexota bacterium]
MYNPLFALLIAVLLTALGILLFTPERGAFWKWQRTRQLTERVLREDALKHIYHCENHNEIASIDSLAGAISISTNQAAEVIESLQELELLKAEGARFRLLATGREYALQVIRAHRLYERYLADETGYDEVDWHQKAHQQEHNLSPEDIATLSARLGHPTHDPHGDPIPMSDGTIIYPEERIALADLAPDTIARIVHLEDEPESIYAQLVAEGLHIGQEVRLLETSPKRIRFLAGENERILAPIFAANIAVIPISEEPVEEILPGYPLSEVPIGTEAEVVALSARIRGVERRRLMDLGILPGTNIEVEMSSASGDPVAYRVRGAVIALRKSQAAHINVSTKA